MDRVRTGWLSPSGEFFTCESYEHDEKAQEILNEYSGITPDDELLNRGYVRISIMSLLDHGYLVYWKKHLTPEQVRFLRPYYEGECGLPMTLNSKYEFEDELATI